MNLAKLASDLIPRVEGVSDFDSAVPTATIVVKRFSIEKVLIVNNFKLGSRIAEWRPGSALEKHARRPQYRGHTEKMLMYEYLRCLMGEVGRDCRKQSENCCRVGGDQVKETQILNVCLKRL